jgi:signal transduction histidine kinase
MLAYLVLAASLSVTTAIGLALQQVVPTNPIAFLLCVPPILVTALAGGLRPSLAATAAGGLVAEYFFREPYRTLPRDPEEIVPLSLYLLIGAGISVLSERLDRARLEAQSREQEFDSLMKVNPIGIAIANDRDCRHISANPALAAMLRLRPDENASLSATPSDRPPFRVFRDGVEIRPADLPLQRAAREGIEVRDVEIDVEHADGTRVSLYEYATPLFDERGEVRGAIGAFLDISERRRAEVALRQALDENAALYQEAQAANRLKDQFLATLSHELRTPLNALLGWIQLLRSGQVSEGTRQRALAAIERSAELQARLTSDLLDVSAAMRGKLRLDPAEGRLDPVVTGVVESQRAIAEEKGVELHLAVDPDLPPMTLDPARIQQVAGNLISNAIKFTPAGGTVRVRVASRGDQVELSVRDTGVGIPPVFLPFVFDRFRQADAGTTREHGGLGLGLAIVRNLVDLHGGHVVVASEGPNTGSTFTVVLPATPRPAAHTPSRDPHPAAARDRPWR